ncbi:dihydroxyacetone kinase subunit L [Bacillus aquiflavi]|uniref:phosphoenolpyruvate--glycerone phosphotransferase n=1 Tax=Bacillus aquiflavi TaxID=2672567 RepID=A0A6B3W2B4_9BACI|nr:dihydroxyacetone kinase subunit DhaL [Bacillus aquiflavi]MBA4537847.1 dihydroxyacetone kinase subunit L [Bacillus aquiflavi]NEY82103.1 dihydroxyacetone kinase subunit L [Bacillus aquiflavi]UAC48447.1 dihydroxyacetone kinase subunit L [Bacillus aquiflavi]
MTVTIDDTVKLLKRIADIIEENKQLLTDLDAVIGDADHGMNLSKGFQAVKDKLNESQFKDHADIFKTVSMTLISKVGGASGPLYGTAFLTAATVVSGKTTLTISDYEAILSAAIKGIQKRGKAEQGDKTMLDVWIPARDAVKTGLEKKMTEINILQAAAKAAYEGMEFTKTIPAKKGRASYLGKRSIGHADPGAYSSYLLIKGIADARQKG